MVAELFAVLFILLAGFVVARLTHLSFVVALPVSLMGIVVTLFFAYMGGALRGAFWVLVTLIVASAALIVIRDRSTNGLIRILLSPQAVVFAIASVGMALMTSGRVVGLWDELRLWAGYPKILFFDSSLQLAPNAQLFEPMRNYTPGMPLAAYLTNAFSSGFSEHRVFLAYGLVAATLLLPVSARITWRTWYLIPVAVITIIVLPLLLWNSSNDFANFYASLYVDPIVGIVLGFLCWLVGIGMARQSGGSLAMGVTAAALYLFKDGMFALAIVLLLAASLQVLRDHDAVVRVRVLRLLSMVAPLVIVTAVWKFELRVNDVPNYLAFDYTSIHHQLSVIKKFGEALLHQPLIRTTIESQGRKGWILFGAAVAILASAFMTLLAGYRSIRSMSWSLSSALMAAALGLFGVVGVVALAIRFASANGEGISFAMVSLLLATASTAVFFLTRATTGRASAADYLAGLGTLVVVNMLYVVGIYFLVAGPFRGELSSFARYVSVLPTAGVVFLGLFVAARNWPATRSRRTLLASGMASLALASIALLLPVRSPASFDGGWNHDAVVNSQTILAGVGDGVGTASDPVRVFYVNTDDIYAGAGLHHRTYFDLIGTGASVANFYIDTNITSSSSDPSAVQAARARFLSTIASGGYDYVYFASTSPELVEQFDTLFPSGIHVGDVYRVDRTQSTPTFSPTSSDGHG